MSTLNRRHGNIIGTLLRAFRRVVRPYAVLLDTMNAVERRVDIAEARLHAAVETNDQAAGSSAEKRFAVLEGEIDRRSRILTEQLSREIAELRSHIDALGQGLRSDLNETVARRMTTYLGENRALTLTWWGARILVNTNDASLTHALILGGEWERGVTKVFTDIVQEGMNVLEVGANVGYYTLLGATRIGPTGRMFSFEAVPEIFDFLHANVEINGMLDRVTPVNMAAYHEQTQLTFNVLDRHKASGSIMHFSEGFLEYYRDRKQEIVVEAIPLDRYDFGGVVFDVVKIDAEGSEPYVIKGMENLLRANPQIRVICEFSRPMLIASGGAPAFLDQLTHLGFQISQILEPTGELRPVTAEQLMGPMGEVVGDLLLTRPTTQ